MKQTAPPSLYKARGGRKVFMSLQRAIRDSATAVVFIPVKGGDESLEVLVRPRERGTRVLRFPIRSITIVAVFSCSRSSHGASHTRKQQPLQHLGCLFNSVTCSDSNPLADTHAITGATMPRLQTFRVNYRRSYTTGPADRNFPYYHTND